MVEYRIALPLGQDANKDKHCLDFLLVFYGGYTVGPEHDGAWKDPETGVLHRDKMRPVYIAIDPEKKEGFFRDLQDIRKDYNQIALYVVEPGGTVVIVR